MAKRKRESSKEQVGNTAATPDSSASVALVPVKNELAVVLNDETVESFQRERFIREVPELNDLVFAALKKQIADGNKDAIKLGLEMLGLVKAGGGFQIQTNIFNQTNNIRAKSEAESFATIVRDLDKARRSGTAEEAMDIRERHYENVIKGNEEAIDAEFVDVE